VHLQLQSKTCSCHPHPPRRFVRCGMSARCHDTWADIVGCDFDRYVSYVPRSAEFLAEKHCICWPTVSAHVLGVLTLLNGKPYVFLQVYFFSNNLLTNDVMCFIIHCEIFVSTRACCIHIQSCKVPRFVISWL